MFHFVPGTRRAHSDIKARAGVRPAGTHVIEIHQRKVRTCASGCDDHDKKYTCKKLHLVPNTFYLRSVPIADRFRVTGDGYRIELG